MHRSLSVGSFLFSDFFPEPLASLESIYLTGFYNIPTIILLFIATSTLDLPFRAGGYENNIGTPTFIYPISVIITALLFITSLPLHPAPRLPLTARNIYDGDSLPSDIYPPIYLFCLVTSGNPFFNYLLFEIYLDSCFKL